MALQCEQAVSHGLPAMKEKHSLIETNSNYHNYHRTLNRHEPFSGRLINQGCSHLVSWVIMIKILDQTSCEFFNQKIDVPLF